MSNLPPFRNLDLLQRALTHRSYVNEHPDAGEHNERLEFLGDALLNFLSGEYLYQRFPDKPESELTPMRSALVDEAQLARFAIAIDLAAAMRLGRGAEMEGGRQNPNLLSSTFEAIIGAYFLDTNSDINAIRTYTDPLFNSVADTLLIDVPRINFKSRFQQWALANLGENPRYVIIGQSGPDHAKQFTAEVQVQGKPYGCGTGRRVQDAQKQAAADALQKLGL